MKHFAPVWVLAGFFGLAVVAGPAWSQSAPASSNAEAEPQRWLAHRLAQLARDSAARSSDPAIGVAAAAVLLSDVEVLDPGHAVWPWLSHEANRMLGERAHEQAALSRYLRLNPSDDAAQWKLVQLLAHDRGNVQDRLALLDRVLKNSEADTLGNALRGRIAFQAAVLSRESGDRAGYLERLQEALRIDPAFSAAHARLYQLLRNENRPAAETVSALLLLLETRPTDSGLREEGAGWLMRCGQYALATRWYEAAVRLGASSESPDRLAGMMGAWAMAMWGAGDDAAALKLLEEAQQAGGAAASLLSLEIRIRETAGDEPGAEAAFEKLRDLLKAANEQNPQSPQPLIDRIQAHVLFGRKLDEVDALVELLTRHFTDQLPQNGRLYGWWLLRRGKYAEAAELLKRTAASDAASAYGLALAEAAGAELSLDTIRLLHARQPDGLLGIDLARQVMKRGGGVVPGADCAEVAGLLGVVPPGGLVPDQPLVRLTISSDRRTVVLGEPVSFRLNLVNRWRVPLELEPGGAIDSRVLIEPQVQVGPDSLKVLPGFWIDAAHRLRLSPGQGVSVDLALDSRTLAEWLWSDVAVASRFRLRAVVNPVADASGHVLAGLGGAEGLSDWVERAGTGSDDAALQANLNRLSTAGPTETMSILAGLIRLMAEGEDPHPRAQAVAQWLSENFGRLSELQQAWVVAAVPTSDLAYRLFGPVLQQAQGSGSLLVKKALVAGHWSRSAPGWLEKIGAESRSEKLQMLCALLAEVRSRPAEPGQKPPSPARRVDR